MIDALVGLLPRARAKIASLRQPLGVQDDYLLVTLHRPSNVDDPVALKDLMTSLAEIARAITVVFPVHSRTQQRIANIDYIPTEPNLKLTNPLGYLDFLALQMKAKLVSTDSGGIQEETTFMEIPCLTIRNNTERPITITERTNSLVGNSHEQLTTAVWKRLHVKKLPTHRIPKYWDGHTSERGVQVLVEACFSSNRQC